jgi:hypothetical protein
MTILPPAVLTTVQLINGLAASAKNALDLARASSNRALNDAVKELRSSLFDVEKRVLDLDEENRNLKAELSLRNGVDGPLEPHGYFFYKDKRDKPLCPKCFQSLPRHPLFLTQIVNGGGGSYRDCLFCHERYYETPEQLSQPVRMGRPTIGSIRNR